MDDKELNLWREDGDGERAARFFADVEADETTKKRIRAKTLDLTVNPAPARPFWKKMPKARYIIAAVALVLICAALVNFTRDAVTKYSLTTSGQVLGGGAVADNYNYAARENSQDGAAFFGDYEEAMPMEAPMAEASARSAPVYGGSGQNGEAAPNATGEDKIIYTLNAQLRVNSVEEAMRGLEAQARKLGGYVSASRQNNQDYWQYGSLNLRVPAESFAEFTDSLSDWGTVMDKYIYSNDVTEEYMDTDSRLKSWQAQEERYLEFFAAAETVEEMIMIESALSEVRREKEALAGQLKYWDSKVSYSEVNLELSQQRTDVAVTDPWQPVSFSRTLEAAKNAVIKTVSTAWNGFNKLVVILGYALPVLIILLILGLILRVVLRKRKARRQNALTAAVGPAAPTETSPEDIDKT
ncbi:MAG: DUF4349 domain-containing protein, partial [Gracilibacteraceae bacterium]|nr:DUF4349 domain-containing protein [Gracilibacteraceae bacterium]